MPRMKKTNQGSARATKGKMETMDEEKEPQGKQAEYGRRSTTPRSAARQSGAKSSSTPRRGGATSPSRARTSARKSTAAKPRAGSSPKARKSGRKSSRSK